MDLAFDATGMTRTHAKEARRARTGLTLLASLTNTFIAPTVSGRFKAAGVQVVGVRSVSSTSDATVQRDSGGSALRTVLEKERCAARNGTVVSCGHRRFMLKCTPVLAFLGTDGTCSSTAS
jgi:hypothetical protein